MIATSNRFAALDPADDDEGDDDEEEEEAVIEVEGATCRWEVATAAGCQNSMTNYSECVFKKTFLRMLYGN